jgi:hypothetical protein
VLGHRLTTAQVGQLNTPVITLAIVEDLVPIALWAWVAQKNGQGRNWAHSLSTALFGLAMLNLTGAFRMPVIRVGADATVFGPIIPVLIWLVGLAAAWLLWRPASTAFFRPQGFARVPPATPRSPRHLQGPVAAVSSSA